MTKQECIKNLEGLVEASRTEYRQAINDDQWHFVDYNIGRKDAFLDAIALVEHIEECKK